MHLCVWGPLARGCWVGAACGVLAMVDNMNATCYLGAYGWGEFPIRSYVPVRSRGMEPGSLTIESVRVAGMGHPSNTIGAIPL